MSHIANGLPAGLTVTICGGSNSAHTTAAYLGSKPGLSVNVLTRRPQLWSKTITLATEGTFWEYKGVIVGTLNEVSDDPSKVIPSADIVLVACPAHTHPLILKKIAPHISKQCLLGSIYCQGGFDWAVQESLGSLANVEAVFGLQNIPWICNAPEYGKRAKLIGPKKRLFLACTPIHKQRELCVITSLLFDIPTSPVANFLSLTLTPSNQIIHPARYYGLYKDWDGQSAYKHSEIQWGLYSQFDEAAAMWLEKLDKELQSIKQALVSRYPSLDLTAVLPIGERIVKQYGQEVTDTSGLQAIFNSNKGYAGCVTPMKKLEDGSGYHLATQSRLFWEDIPYGLCILKSLAQMLELETPTVDLMINWHQGFMGKEFLLKSGKLNPALLNETGAPERYGLTKLDDLVASSLPSLANA